MLNYSIATPLKTYTIEDFNRALAGICGSFQVEPPTKVGKIVGEVSIQSFAGLDVAFVAQNSKHIRRTKQDISKSPGNHFFLIMQTCGKANMEQGDIFFNMVPGDMFLVDSTKPCYFGCDSQLSQQISLHLPRNEMAYRFGDIKKESVIFHHCDALCQSMQHLLSEIINNSNFNQVELIEVFYSLLGIYLSKNTAAYSSLDSRQYIFKQASKIISNHFKDPDLSPVYIAEKLGISLRQLHRAFQLFNKTPHKYLQQKRLSAATYLIEQQAQKKHPLPISSIAFECGFRELSTFYRQYRKHHHGTPKTRLAHSSLS